MQMGVRGQTCTEWQTSLFYGAVSMSQKIPSESGQIITWLQTCAHKTIQTPYHHSLRNWRKPPKTSVRITTDSVEIQTWHHPNKNQKPTCDWQIMTTMVTMMMMMMMIMPCYLHLSVVKSATAFWSPLSSLQRLGQIWSRLVNAESCRTLGSSLIQSKVSLTVKEQYWLPEE
jgi:hypothetical protein